MLSMLKKKSFDSFLFSFRFLCFGFGFVFQKGWEKKVWDCFEMNDDLVFAYLDAYDVARPWGHG